MLEVHRVLLTHNRTFLLRNIFPSEEFWSLLQEKELLTCDMLEDIKVGQVTRSPIHVPSFLYGYTRVLLLQTTLNL